MRTTPTIINLLVIGSNKWIDDLEEKIRSTRNVKFNFERLTNEECIQDRLSHNHYDILIVEGGYCKNITDSEIALLGFAMGRPVQVIYNKLFSYIINRLFMFKGLSSFRVNNITKDFIEIRHQINRKFIDKLRALSKIYNEFFVDISKSIDDSYSNKYMKNIIEEC